jgi:hypothetical protein
MSRNRSIIGCWHHNEMEGLGLGWHIQDIIGCCASIYHSPIYLQALLWHYQTYNLHYVSYMFGNAKVELVDVR